ncbi:MAG: lipopolysaccharide heptosyltransferase II [Candidatus Desulfofervidus sp.]|nr:lipopolysaccharide heptosyltransferase II [Candidatus Desulfofervidus sp.]
MDKGEIRILVRAPNWLGDAIMGLPFLENLRYIYPQAHIGIWCKSHLRTLFKAYSKIDQVIIYPNSVFSLLRSCLKLRYFSACILLPNSFSSALSAFFTGIPQRIGYATDGRDLLLTQRYPPPEQEALHQIDYYLHLLKCMGYKVKHCIPTLNTLPEGEEEQKRLRLKYGWQRDYIVFAPGAAYGPAKCWPPAYFAELAKKIKKTGQDVLILGTQKDNSIARKILQYLGDNKKGIYNLTGLTSLAGAMSIVKKSISVVTNDSGLMHLTAALKHPQIALFGPTNPKRTAPYGETTKIIYHQVTCAPCKYRQCPKEHICMRQITVEEVFNIIEEALS